LLRLEAGRDPHDRALSALVGELSTQSEEFRGHWATHNVRLHHKGEKRFNHPVVGELELSYNRIELPADPGLMFVAYSPEPGSKSAEAFGLLASWAARTRHRILSRARFRRMKPGPTGNKADPRHRGDRRGSPRPAPIDSATALSRQVWIVLLSTQDGHLGSGRRCLLRTIKQSAGDGQGTLAMRD
jgi:hypothetical protein